jgi:hypothetical protein
MSRRRVDDRKLAPGYAIATVSVGAPGIAAKERAGFELLYHLVAHRTGLLQKRLAGAASTNIDHRVGLRAGTLTLRATTFARPSASLCDPLHEVLDRIVAGNVQRADWARAVALARHAQAALHDDCRDLADAMAAALSAGGNVGRIMDCGLATPAEALDSAASRLVRENRVFEVWCA